MARLTFGFIKCAMNRLVYYLVSFQFLIITGNITGQSVVSSERTFLRTDRDVYIAGEELFFTCYRFDPSIQNKMEGSRFAYFVLRNERNVLIQGICLRLDSDRFSGNIYLPDTLSTGYYQLVSYTNCMRNDGEKSFFTKEILIANRFDKDFAGLYRIPSVPDTVNRAKLISDTDANHYISITPEKSVYGKRDKIKIALDAFGLKNNEIATFSVSVREQVPGFTTNTFTSDPFISSATSDVNQTSCKYLPEIKGILLKGKALNSDTDQPIPNTTVFLSTPDTVANLQFTRTAQDGTFQFLLNDYYNNRNLVLTLPDVSKGRIELDDKYQLNEPFIPSAIFPDSAFKAYLVKSQNIVQVQKTYKTELAKKLVNNKPVEVDPPLVYPPVKTPVYPADFVSLPDFVEISREILPLLKTRKHGGKYECWMVDLTSSMFFDSEPLIFLDGVPINNINQIIGLGTEKINKIESVGSERYYGNRYFDGILSVFTKKQEIANIAWQTPMLTINYVQLQPSSVFVAQKHSYTDRSPDFRQTLYWEPLLSLKANEKRYIEFSASDDKGEFEVTVQGVTSSGSFIRVTHSLKIGYSSK